MRARLDSVSKSIAHSPGQKYNYSFRRLKFEYTSITYVLSFCESCYLYHLQNTFQTGINGKHEFRFLLQNRLVALWTDVQVKPNEKTEASADG